MHVRHLNPYKSYLSICAYCIAYVYMYCTCTMRATNNWTNRTANRLKYQNRQRYSRSSANTPTRKLFSRNGFGLSYIARLRSAHVLIATQTHKALAANTSYFSRIHNRKMPIGHIFTFAIMYIYMYVYCMMYIVCFCLLSVLLLMFTAIGLFLSLLNLHYIYREKKQTNNYS